MTYAVASQQVSWWSVHKFAVPRLQQAGDWPLVGSPPWCQLDDDDPVKWTSIIDASQHWALRLETCQEHFRGASKLIAASVNWSALAHQIRDLDDFYRGRPWLRRVKDR